MTEFTTATAIRHEITLDVPQERAFALFTERFDEVKPRDHTLLTVPIARSVLEPFVGGRLYDLAVDGSTVTWGRVLVFEPPERFVFSWQLDPGFELESDPARFSEVEVRFVSGSPGRTRVELEHRHLDRHGAAWESERDAVAGPNGWPLYLARFAVAATG
ncbi:MAG TPA: SRPBCC family protein [Cellulomonas sp.]